VLGRYQITARIGADYPRWYVWHDAPTGRYYARRRGRFRALSEPGAPLVLRVLGQRGRPADAPGRGGREAAPGRLGLLTVV